MADYLAECDKYLTRDERALDLAAHFGLSVSRQAELEQLKGFIEPVRRQLDQFARCLLLGEKTPHEEKVFSIFQTHTRWIVRSKAGVSQELGVSVCVVEDQHRFILHQRIMLCR